MAAPKGNKYAVGNEGGRPLAFDSVEELQQVIDDYFSSDDAYMDSGGERVFAPTMSGLAMYVGVDRKTITNYAHKDEFFPTIKRARQKIEQFLEQRLYGNAVTGVIFSLKNNYEWSDKQEIEMTEKVQDDGSNEW